nr:type II toxin-antitoxin system RelE/ParE family toxin [Salmonella enterica]
MVRTFRAEKGLIDANSGDGGIKLRVARRGQGKSGGFCTIVLYKAVEKVFLFMVLRKTTEQTLAPMKSQHSEKLRLI